MAPFFSGKECGHLYKNSEALFLINQINDVTGVISRPVITGDHYLFNQLPAGCLLMAFILTFIASHNKTTQRTTDNLYASINRRLTAAQSTADAAAPPGHPVSESAQ
ncbi:hypothetical protein OJE16_09180 [Pantoea tagorei]